jgi:hypothetical protein
MVLQKNDWGQQPVTCMCTSTSYFEQKWEMLIDVHSCITISTWYTSWKKEIKVANVELGIIGVCRD